MQNNFDGMKETLQSMIECLQEMTRRINDLEHYEKNVQQYHFNQQIEPLKNHESLFDHLKVLIENIVMNCDKSDEKQKKNSFVGLKDTLDLLIKQFNENTQMFINLLNNKYQNYSNQLNKEIDNCLEIDPKVKKENGEIDEEYVQKTYTQYYINTEMKKEQDKREFERIKDQKIKQMQTQLMYSTMKNSNNIFNQDLINESIAQINRIESAFGRKIIRKAFDSTANKWRKNDSSFFELIKNKSNIIILIKTVTNHFFGAFIKSQINAKDIFIKDEEAFVFQIDEFNSLKKYPIKSSSEAIQVFDDSNDYLFKIGQSNDFSVFGKSWKGDIYMKKRPKRGKAICYCHESSFDYSVNDEINHNQRNRKNVLLQTTDRIYIDSFVVFETTTDDSEFFQNETIYNKEKMKEFKEKNEELETTIKTMTNKKIDSILFDSNNENDNWKLNTSVFNERIVLKDKLLFLIETKCGEYIGMYIDNQIQEKFYGNYLKTTNKSFLFNLDKKNGFKGRKMFMNKDNNYGYCLFESISRFLITIGDITLMKQNFKHKSFLYINKNRYNYDECENPFVQTNEIDKYGQISFDVERILVFQMKE